MTKRFWRIGLLSYADADELIIELPTSMRKDISTAEIVRLYTEEKAAYRTIATRLGVSVEVVRGRLKKARVNSRTAGEGKHQSQLRP